ncbi:MAG: aminotransferase class V-fold PLP-dependent enzyme [Verrucomicrobia bacterium]|nr:aminotransferase class V-fold PLP-dependent enzyme [Verrucomicrobiota bacterium]
MLTHDRRRQDFPGLESMTYLNTAAESVPPRCVGHAIQQYWEDKQRGMRGRDAHFAQLDACREITARLLALVADEVSFCSCSSEAYNLLASALNLEAGDEVVVTDLDFPAGATPWLRVHPAPNVRLWPSRDGALSLEDLAPLLSERTRLAQVSLISFYNGFRLDCAALAAFVRRLAPDALLSVDVTQAFGRVELHCADADILISSTYKWSLGIHGGCVVAVPKRRAASLTTRAGGWFHLANAFEADRFQRAVPREGAASFAVGMPNFAALYALNASLRYLDAVGIRAISEHADALVARTHRGLVELGLTPIAPYQPGQPTGILAFRHPKAAELHAALEAERIHVMHQVGRIRVALHGYNTDEDVGRLLAALGKALKRL